MEQNEDTQLSDNELEAVSGGDTGTDLGITAAGVTSGFAIGAVSAKLLTRQGPRPDAIIKNMPTVIRLHV